MKTKTYLLITIFTLMCALSACAETVFDGNVVSLKELLKNANLSDAAIGHSNYFLTADRIIFFRPELHKKFSDLCIGNSVPFKTKVQIVDREFTRSMTEEAHIEAQHCDLKVGEDVISKSELMRNQISESWIKAVNYFDPPGFEIPATRRRLKDASIVAISSKLFLVTGGHWMNLKNLPEPISDIAYVFDSDEGKVIKTFKLREKRWRHRSFLLPSGQVLLAGGFVTVEGTFPRIELVNVGTGTSKILKCRMPAVWMWGTGCIDQQGRCLLIGGDWSQYQDNLAIVRVDIAHETTHIVGHLKFSRCYPAATDASSQHASVLNSSMVLVSLGDYHDLHDTMTLIKHHRDAEVVTIIP